MREWIILRPLIGMLFSRKFLALFLAALVASGAAWASDFEQWIPVILIFGSGLYATLTAWEDAATKRATETLRVITPETPVQNVDATVLAPHEPPTMAQEPGLDVDEAWE